MAKSSTVSIGFKFEDGEDGFKRLTFNADEFKKVMSQTVVESEKLEGKIVNFGQLSIGLDALSSAFQDLQGFVGEMGAAYDVQMEAERQLEQVMKNTMDARAEDVQSIKDFCSAQQQIGIVGDEVQIAGAQELATYLSMKGSLKSLIPVMNDMVAQQYGYNHTAENAVNIATMLGKVMNGQTGALSRYGYTFDEAQEKILKFGTESERVAVLVDVVSESVGGMNEKLANTDSGLLKQMENNLGDMKEQLGGLLKGSEYILSVGSNAVIAGVGLFKMASGVKTLYTSMLKIPKSIGFVNKGLKELSLLVRTFPLYCGAVGIAIAAVAAAFVYFTAKSDEAKAALKEIGDAKDRARRESEMLKEAQEAEADAMQSAQSSIELNIAKLKNFNGTKEEEKKLVKEMNNTYGDTMGYFKSAAEWYNTLVANSKAYCRQLVNEAKARKLADQIAELEMDRDKLTTNEDGSKKKYSNEKKHIDHWEEVTEDRNGRPYRHAVPVMKSDRDYAQEAYDDKTRLINAKRKQLESIPTKVEMPVMGAASPDAGGSEGGKGSGNGNADSRKTRLQEINTLIGEYEEKWVTASETEKTSIKEAVTGLKEEKKTIELSIAELSRPMQLEGTEDFNAEIDYQRKLLESASEDNRRNIEDTISSLETQRDALALPTEYKSLDDYNKALSHYQSFRNTVTAEELALIDAVIRKLEEEKEAFERLNSPEVEIGLEDADTFEKIDAAIAQLDNKMNRAAADEIDGLQRTRMAFEEKRKVLERGIEIPKMQQEAAEMQALPQSELLVRIRDMGFDELTEKIALVNSMLADMDNPPTEGHRQALLDLLDVYEGWREKSVDTTGAVADALNQAQSAFSGMGDAFDVPALNIAGIIAGAVATMIQGFATASSESTSMGPFGWLGFSLAGLAQLAAMVSQLKGMAAFADGGIVSGPTLGLVGEYAGASHNPEVIAPLDRLKDIIGGDDFGAKGHVEFEIRGDRLYGILKKHERRLNRT